MPVYINEPLSMLIRGTEMFEYTHLLRTANQTTNEYIRIAYVTSFLFMNLAQNCGRGKKPFNPLLGETFDVMEGDLRVICEQVSHHPPISAFYGECPDFELWAKFSPKTKFSLTKLEVEPGFTMYVRLKGHDEVYTIQKCKGSVHGFMKNEIYMWNFGVLTCKCFKNGVECRIKFKDHPFWGKLDYSVKGEVYDQNGNSFIF